MPEEEEEETVQGPPVSSGTPEQVRVHCATAVMKLATDLSNNAASLMRIATRMGTGAKMSGVVRRYGSSGQALADKVVRLAQPVLDLEDAARGRKGRDRRTVVKREPVAEPDNVVRPAFTA